MKYVVINVYESEITKVGTTDTLAEATKVGNADTLAEATKIMKNDFMDIFLEHYEEEDFKKEGDGWGLYETEAWLNTSYTNYYWEIIEVD